MHDPERGSSLTQNVNTQLWTGDQRARRKVFRHRADARARVGRRSEMKSDRVLEGSLMPRPGLISVFDQLARSQRRILTASPVRTQVREGDGAIRA